MDINKISKFRLSHIRQRLGAKDEIDTSKDWIIEDMDAKEVVATWTGWVLGDEDLGREIIEFYEILKSAQ